MSVLPTPSVLLIGGSGYIGTALSAHLRGLGHRVIVLSRSAPVLGPEALASRLEQCGQSGLELRGHYPTDLSAAIAASTIIINLAGQSVLTTPWTKAGKLAILNSRVEPALAAATALLRAAPYPTPKTYIQGAGISIYRPSPMLQNESGATGTMGCDREGFLSHVCKSWEAPAEGLADRARELGLPLRIAIVRIGMVLGQGAAAEQPLIRLARLGLAGGLKYNRQWQSAITITDLCRLFAWLTATTSAKGVYNGVAPTPLTLAEFYPPLRERFGWQLGLPRVLLESTAAFGLKLLLGEKAEMALSQFRLSPAKALAEGFTFLSPQPLRDFPHL